MHPVRLLCALFGAAPIALLGAVLVSDLLRGVAPFDLEGLTLATAPERFDELAPPLCLALGVLAIVAATTEKRRLWTVLAALLTALIIWIAVTLNHEATMVEAVFRLAFLGGGTLITTALIAMTTQHPQGQQR